MVTTPEDYRTAPEGVVAQLREDLGVELNYDEQAWSCEGCVNSRRPSTLAFDGFHSLEENMAIESSARIIFTTGLGLR
jgi:hypothetical protein